MSPSLRAIRWRLILTSIVAVVLALGSFYLNQWVYAASDDQCVWRVQDRQVRIQQLLPNGAAENAGLLEGDELLLIHGRKVTAPEVDKAQRFINTQPEGRVLVYTVKRDGRVLRLPVKLVKPFNITSLIILLTGLVAWATGLLVVISSPSRKSARHYYYMGLVSLLANLWFTLRAANLPPPYLVLCLLLGGLGAALGPPLWLHFFLRFPHPFALRTHRRFLAALYGCSIGGTALVLAERLIRALGRPGLGRGFLRFMAAPPVRGLFFGFLAAVALAGLALFWAGTRRQRSRKRKALLPALLITSALLADLVCYHYFLLRGGGQSLSFARGSWVWFAPLPLLPVAFATAIFRQGFFDVRRAILRWVSYFIVLGLILAGYLGGVAFLFAQGLQDIPPGWAGVLVGLSALPIGWLLRFLLLGLRRRFHRDLNTAREAILGDLRSNPQRFSEEGILDCLAEALRSAFQPQLLLLLPAEADGFPLPAVPADPDQGLHGVNLAAAMSFRLPPGLLRRARENQELVLGLQSDEADWIREQGPALRAHMDALEAQVLALILVNEAPYAALILGGKYAELNYGREDRELLREVALATGRLLETALLHGRLLDQGRIEQELHTARLIQQSLITTRAPVLAGFQVALRLDPALETGGDLLWVGRRPTGRYIAAVGDVSGKGLPAALYMSQAMALLTFAAQQKDLDFDQILPALDKTLRNLLGPKDFLTLSLLEWDAAGHYRVARAGHPPSCCSVPGAPARSRPTAGAWACVRPPREIGRSRTDSCSRISGW